MLLLQSASPPPAYSATVVDATTNQPLAGVSVRNPELGAAATSTDARGYFSVAGSPRVLALARLGYAPLRLEVPAAPGGADTLRLLLRSYALAEVAVRPPRASTLASVPANGPELGRRLYPGQAVALLLQCPASAPTDQPCVVSEVRLFLSERPRQGRLRVRLVEVFPGPPTQPGSRDLLPTPALFSTEQLAHATKEALIVDVNASNLLLPTAGLCVVVECLPTEPVDQDAAVTIAPDAWGRTAVTLASPSRQPPRTYPGPEFPLLVARRGAGTGTWSYHVSRPGWTTRSAISYTVRAEVGILSY